MELTFTIPGEPKGKGRPRLGRSGHAYTPHDTAVYENLVKVCFRDEYPGHEPLAADVPVRAVINAYYSMPKSASKRKQMSMLWGWLRPVKKPDCDNIAKIVCDALNGIVYYDDSQIVELTVIKKYAETPQVDVKIEALKNEDDGKQHKS